MITLTTASLILAAIAAVSVANDFYITKPARATIGGVSVGALGVAGVVSALAGFVVAPLAIAVGLGYELYKKISIRREIASLPAPALV